jgi:hypothetical protein
MIAFSSFGANSFSPRVLHAFNNDKNSPWDKLNTQKKGVVCQEEKSQDKGGFLKTSREDLDKQISERYWDDPREDIHSHQSIKGGFYLCKPVT